MSKDETKDPASLVDIRPFGKAVFRDQSNYLVVSARWFMPMPTPETSASKMKYIFVTSWTNQVDEGK